MAWVLASLSQLVYDRFEDGGQVRDDLIKKLASGGFELLPDGEFNDPENDTQAFLVKNLRNNYAVLAFRGTEVSKQRDITTDAKVLKVKDFSGKVKLHGGFKKAFEENVQAKIEACLMKHAKDMPLYITGHSLGAALATVAVRHLEQKKYFRDLIAACYTYGSPRVGNKALDDALKSPIYRVANTTDIVTMVPSIGYRHTGDDRFLNREGTKIYRDVPFLERAVLVLMSVMLIFSPLVIDHAIAEYRRKLEKIARTRNEERRMRG
jgi:predicted lipase